MDTKMLVWLLGGTLVVLLALLIVTRIARRMDGGRAAIQTSLPGPLLKALGASPLAEGGASEKAKKQGAALASVGVSLAVVGAIVAIFSEFNDKDTPPVTSEISAGPLRGTLVSARDKDPVVLIVPGSGPTDRDGNSPAGLRTDAYKLLAEGLAEEGIASVRVDKSGMFASAGAGDPNAVTPQSYVNDYHAWIDAIKAGRGSKCVWLLGHSEGALMVSLAAAGRKDVCGLILIAGMGRKMSDVIRRQLRDNPANAPVLAEALRAIDELEAGRHVETAGMHPALLSLFSPKVQDYLIAVFAIDPVEAVRRAGKKTLVIQGTTDLQVSLEDARLLDKAPRTRLQVIEGMNHVLKEAPAERTANLATYSDPALPLAPKLVRRIKDFIKDDD